MHGGEGEEWQAEGGGGEVVHEGAHLHLFAVWHTDTHFCTHHQQQQQPHTLPDVLTLDAWQQVVPRY